MGAAWLLLRRGVAVVYAAMHVAPHAVAHRIQQPVVPAEWALKDGVGVGLACRDGAAGVFE